MNTSLLSTQLTNKLKALERVRQRAELQYQKKKIFKSDLEYMYAGIFIKMTNHFEVFLENLYFGHMTNSLKGSSAPVKTFYSFKNRNLAFKIVKGEQPFIKWMPFENLVQMSQIHFKSEFPFRLLTQADKEILNRISTIRNAIAHTSPASIEKLEKKILNQTRLKPHERNAIGYLRSSYTITPLTSRYQELSDAMSVIAQKLC
ncbi:hypothetical protein [Peredibacter starrii]|uniref:RiboL-PSP-HEPN domain-containing protein n=1 Tax=Peredibacter starrii TaxID=28202 RepID=A0AAX4HSZ2_9BACT|nr:hypothetical protein [Peredibacter starrii]WPU66523.1 hypothetical protein SOO65_07175 [Peredibacter starrii]